MSFPRIIIGITFLLPFNTAVRAGPVTWEFAGEITSVFDPNDFLAGSVTVGTPFSGSYTFESTTLDSSPKSSVLGNYAEAVLGISGQVGGMPFLGSGDLSSLILILNVASAPSFDSYSIIIAPVEADFLGETSAFSLSLSDSTGTAFSSDSLLLSPPDLGLFDSTSFTLGTQSELIILRGEITSLVPEPGTLFLLGLAALVARTRRGQKRRRILSVFGLVVLMGFIDAPNARAQWTDGTVLIGGDDIDDLLEHFINGQAYMREGFNFLGAHVTNSHTVVVCIGCNEVDARISFEAAFDESDLPGMMWTRVILIFPTEIQAFFDNTGTVNIQDAGIIYLPSGPEQSDNSGITQAQLDLVNISANRDILRDFVRDPVTGGGGLFTHTLAGLSNDPYAWLETLTTPAGSTIPDVRALNPTSSGVNELILDCDATATFFGNLTCDEIEQISGATPWHTQFKPAPGETDFGGLVPVARGTDPPGEVVILAAPLVPGSCADCNNNGVRDECDEPDCQPNGIPDECDIADGSSQDCTANGIPDECEPDCNLNGIADNCDITDGSSPDCFSYETDCCFPHAGPGCDDQLIADCVCELPPSAYCCEIGNEWDDACAQVAADSCSASCDTVPDGVPDECQPSPDCNGNSIPDAQEIADGTTPDCNGNCIPEECEPFVDCNNNGVQDSCDIADGTSCDLLGDGVPDECGACCTENGTCQNTLAANCTDPDTFSAGVTCIECTCQVSACCNGSACSMEPICSCRASGGFVADTPGACDDHETFGTCAMGSCCTGPGQCEDRANEGFPCNRVLPLTCMNETRCDNLGGTYVGGASCDDNPCAQPPGPQPPNPPHPEMLGEEVNSKNRYLSIILGNPGRQTAIRVRFVDLPPPFDVWNHDPAGGAAPNGDYFVGEPVQRCENGGEVLFSCIDGTCSNPPPGRPCSTDVDCCGAAGPLPRKWF